MEPVRLRLGELLVDARIITKEQLDEVLAIQKRDGRRLGTLLVEREFINETQLTQILSQQLSVPWVSLYHVDFSTRLLSMVPADVARKYCIVPIYVRHVRGQGDTLYVAMDDPTNLDALRECASWAGLPTRSMIASPADIRRAIDVYYGPDPNAAVEQPDAGSPTGAQAEAETDSVAAPASAGSDQPGAEPATIAEGSEPPTNAATLSGDSAQAQSSQPPVAPDTPADSLAVAQPSEPDAAPGDVPIPRAEELHEVHVDADVAPIVEAGDARDRYDDSVSVEVGEALSLDEILAQRKPAPADGEPRPAMKRSKSGNMLSLTLLDGTTLALPVSRKKSRPRKSSLVGSMQDEPGAEPAAGSTTGPAAYAPQTPREVADEPPVRGRAESAEAVLNALRAAAQGADVTDVLGSHVKWETLFATILELLLQKGLVSEAELLEALKKG